MTRYLIANHVIGRYVVMIKIILSHILILIRMKIFKIM